MGAKKNSRVPPPPHPRKRKQPLPSQKPKPAREDPGAPARLEAILNSPSYLKSDEDVAFLKRDEARGVRLQLDYLKPELLLREYGVRQTIVVFGGTRVVEPAAARRKVRELRKSVGKNPRAKKFSRRLAIARRVLAKSHYYDMAREFGRLVGRAGKGPSDRSLVVMTGGGPGIMEGANRGAYDCGAQSVGLNIRLPNEQFPNLYITPDLCFLFHYFALRKLHFMRRAKALVAFPGGYGTFDELFEALSLIQTRTIKPLPVVLVGKAFWQKAFDVEFLVSEGVIDIEDRDLFWFAESATEVWNGILRWYEKAGEPLVRRGAKRRPR